MRIVVLDGYTVNPGDCSWNALEQLGELIVYDRTEDEQILSRAAGAQIVLTNKTPLNAETLASLPELKFISVLATGFNVVDIGAARSHGIAVSNVPVYGSDSVAQFTFALLLELCHHVGLHSDLVRDGEWSKQKDFCFWRTPLIELTGRRMGIVGFGRIGRRVGELAHAFGMDVLVNSRTMTDRPGYEPFAFGTVEEVFAKSDVVSLHYPLTPQNKEMINGTLLNLMKPSAMLLNTARGLLVHEDDLADALNSNRLAGAAVDVASQEPIAPDNPLLRARNCIITPHIAWATLAARKRLIETAAKNVSAFINARLINVVN